ncbi:uncharacterized protein LOC133032138 [Cannabis sativa]|uniref:uncharacterized protein LOC133032138 n=1 Tax=Cannabis sativa TaxID=3483 RepID=UPI0029CA358C|nr:uncharacterized protein LOC133032138 [Cannabis sativa]
MAADGDQSEVQTAIFGVGINPEQSNRGLQVVPVKNPLEDPASPYFLHHGDNLGNSLVSQPLTGQDNYVSWCRAMQLAISVKNKIGFLDGSIPKPYTSDQNLYNAWYRNNNIVISWILNSVSKEISSSILYDECASAIWNDLKVRFHQKNGPHIYNLRKDLMNLKQENQTISMHFTKLKTIWEELTNYRPSCTCNGCTCGGVKKLQDHYHMEYIMSFLMGLSDSFSQVRGSILLMDPLPEVNRVFHLVTQEEHQRGTNSAANPNNSSHAMAFAFQNDKKGNQKDDTQASRSHPPKRNRPFCTHCNILGHTIEKCYKIHSYPPGFNKQNKSKEAGANQVQTGTEEDTTASENHAMLPQLTNVQYQQLLNLLASQQTGNNVNEPGSSSGNSSIILSHNYILPLHNSWIIDTGATRHICSNIKLFQCICKISPTKLILPNNNFLMVNQSGTVNLGNNMTLDNVLYAPTFKYNIIYVRFLTKNTPISIKFTSDKFIMQDNTSNKMIGRGNEINDLYVL